MNVTPSTTPQEKGLIVAQSLDVYKEAFLHKALAICVEIQAFTNEVRDLWPYALPFDEALELAKKLHKVIEKNFRYLRENDQLFAELLFEENVLNMTLICLSSYAATLRQFRIFIVLLFTDNYKTLVKR